MTMPLSVYLDDLKAATGRAAQAEDAFRREISVRTRELELERAFSFRRLNFMRAIADAIASAESEEIAVAGAMAVMRNRLGWSSDSDARAEALSHFAPVAQAMFSHIGPAGEETEPQDVGEALAAFETWYRETHPAPFWVLFENVMPETPVVDF